tara:strand:+ start:168 stop:560 length:393 start_codon:yes stop_codon:yes gene_type:complete
MANNVRFVDSLKVGAYATNVTGSNGGGITIDNNVNNYILTATGNPNIINGESRLRFDGENLIIGEGSFNDVRFEINSTNSSDLMLIKNSNTNTGIKVDNKGILQLLEFSSKPLAIEGGIIFNSNSFWVGI